MTRLCLRRAAGAALILAALSTVGCTTTSGTGGSATSAVVDATKSICRFVPTVATVSALLGQGGTTQTYTDIAKAICAAVQNNPMTEGPGGGRTVPKVRGVPIRGQFV